MWCIGELTQEYRDRMYALLELYARPITAEQCSEIAKKAAESRWNKT